MASGELLSTCLDEIEANLLQCAVCAGNYRNAKVLPCFHSLCEQCIIGLVGNRQQITCPLCRSNHYLPRDGIAGLQNNFFLNSLDELVQRYRPIITGQDETEQEGQQCECSGQGEVTVHCVDCDISLCQDCFDAHDRLPVTTAHVTLPRDEYENARLTNPDSVQPPIPCSTHPDRHADFFCDTCQSLLCAQCAILDHPRPEHHYNSLEEMAAEYKDELEDTMKTLEDREREANDSEEQLRKIADALNERFNTMTVTLDRYVQRMVMQTTVRIKESGEKLLRQLQEEYEERKEKLEEQLEKLENGRAELSSAKQRAENLREYHNAARLLSQKAEMDAKIEQANTVLTKVCPDVDDTMVFRGSDELYEPKTFEVGVMLLTAYELVDVPKTASTGRRIHAKVRQKYADTGRGSMPKVGDIRAKFTGPDQTRGDVTVTQNNDGSFSIKCWVTMTGEHSMTVSIYGQEIQNSPAIIQVH